MKPRNILLILALLAGVAADTPRRLDEDLMKIQRAASEYRPDGSTMAQIERGPVKDTAYVRYSIRKGGQDVVTVVVTLKKTSKGWHVESCAR